jgi:ribosomal protein L23
MKLSKLEVKSFLGSMYGLDIRKVNTLTYRGKRTRDPKTRRTYCRPDKKIAIVHLAEPTALSVQVPYESQSRPSTDD